MNLILLLLSLVMIACILCNKLTSKIGIPKLLNYWQWECSAEWTAFYISGSTIMP